MKIAFLLSLLIILPSISANAESMQELQDRLEKRYEDFYTRMNENNKKSYQTKSARNEHKKLRDKEAREREAARKAYARKKKVEVSDELHQKEIEERQRELEKARKAYVQQQKRLQAVKERLEVPEWVEYKLYEDTLVSDSPAKSSN